MVSLLGDLRYGLKSLAQTPIFTAVSLLTLALGIGGNSAIFSVADALLLRPLPYRHAGRLVIVTNAQGGYRRPFTYARAKFLAGNSQSFDGFAPFVSDSFNLTGRGVPEQLAAVRVAWNFFDVLGVRPARGRTFTAAEDRPGARPVVLISDSLWKRRFGADPRAIGEVLTLDSVATTIIGVMPPDFEFPPLGRSVDIWSSRTFEVNTVTADQIAAATYLIAVARIRPGVDLSRARAEMKILDAQYRAGNSAAADADPKFGIGLNAIQELMVANVRTAVWVLFAAVAFVLLIACANLASLFLSRAITRRKEIAIRLALGASRSTVVRLLLIENLQLSLAGGVLGIILGYWATHAVALLPASTLPRVNPVRMDLQVLAFTLALSILTGVLFGLAPALQFSNPDLKTALRDQARGSGGGRWRNLARSVLVVTQVAMSIVLLVGAGLLIRSFQSLEHVELGFHPENVLLMNIALPPSHYSTPVQISGFFDRVIEQMAEVPGVQAVGASSALPLYPTRYGQMLPIERPDAPLSQRPIQPVEAITPGYFLAMGIPLIAGRDISNRDQETAPPVAVITESFARRYWPAVNAIGKRIFVGRGPQPLEVVGIVGNVKNIRLSAQPVPALYYPLAQRSAQSLNLFIRCSTDPARLAAALRDRVAKVDKDQPVTGIQNMDQYLSESILQNRLTMLLIGIFSSIAMVVAIVGLYGLIAYSVTQRTQEFGVRLALGDSPAGILGLVMRRALWLTILGIGLGLAGSLALTRLMATLLYHVSATDAGTFVTSAVFFLAVALIAGYVPARRAAGLDPSEALRYE